MGQYDRVPFRGEPVTRRHRASILYVEMDPDIDFEFGVYQGSWQSPIDVSGLTHTGAGIMDISMPGMGDNEKTMKVTRILRRRGCNGAMLRGPGRFGGFSTWHWHTFDLDTHGMADSTRWQVGQYRLGNDALSGSNIQPDPVRYRPDPIVKFNWDMWVKLLEEKQDLKRLLDRIDNTQDTLDSLRKERERQRRIINQLLHH